MGDIITDGSRGDLTALRLGSGDKKGCGRSPAVCGPGAKARSEKHYRKAMRQGGLIVSAGVIVGLCVGLGASGATWYVDGKAPFPGGDGKSWETAFNKIWWGIHAASDGDTVIVAEGIYEENVNFNRKNIILRSTDPLDLMVVAETVLDADGFGSVVTFSGTQSDTCVLSGFVIRNGRASMRGGGILGGTESQRTHATIENNVIRSNSGNLYGGGICWCDGIIRKNVIELNSAYDGGGLSDCHGPIENNIIRWNTAEYKGGGLFSSNGVIEGNRIEGNRFISNDAGLGGGLIECGGRVRKNIIRGNSAKWAAGIGGCNGTIENNLIIENSASDSAGGIGGCDGTIRRNVVAGNSAKFGAGVYACDGVIVNNTILRNSATDTPGNVYFCKGTIANCIIWGFVGDTRQQIGDSSMPTNSCIQNWTGGGEGNITLDPLFADPNGPDDNWTTYEDNDYRLVSHSPCIDEGTNSVLSPPGLDMDGNLRIARWKYPVFAYVDMGAYEYGSKPFATTEFGFTEWPPPGGRHLVWNSQPNDTYAVWSSYSARGEWHQVGTVTSQGETTSYTVTGLLPWNWRALFYRVEME